MPFPIKPPTAALISFSAAPKTLVFRLNFQPYFKFTIIGKRGVRQFPLMYCPHPVCGTENATLPLRSDGRNIAIAAVFFFIPPRASRRRGREFADT